MKAAGKNSEQIENSGARQLELSVGAPEKPVESLAVDQAQTRSQVTEPPQEATQKKRDEKLDVWMNNIKEFIRSIDVKSL